MNNTDREFLEERFTRIDAKLDRHGEKFPAMKERWKMVCKLAGIIGGMVALITSIVIDIFWR